MLRDGLYQVTTSRPIPICAGFEVRRGRTVLCAPILQRRLSYWITIAKWICE